jgi:hypothetical protein
MMLKLFSYVVDHDHGLSPNPASGYCTLVHCKFNATGKRRNIVELAKKGNWILGTGGNSHSSAGNGNIVYLMRVDEKLPFMEFLKAPRFAGRADQYDSGAGNEFALVSKHYFYFGKNALSISSLPDSLRALSLEKKGPGHRADLSHENVKAFISWFEENVRLGVHGRPCDPIVLDQSLSSAPKPKCPSCNQGASSCN